MFIIFKIEHRFRNFCYMIFPTDLCDVTMRRWRTPTDYENVNDLLLTPTTILLLKGNKIGRIPTYMEDSCFTTYSNIKRTLSPYFHNLPLLHITIRLNLTWRLLKFMQWFRAGANSGPELELLANSNSNSGIVIGIELAFPSLTGIGIELELRVFELELNWNCHNWNWNWSRNCVLRNWIRNCFPWNWNPIRSPSYPYLQ